MKALFKIEKATAFLVVGIFILTQIFIRHYNVLIASFVIGRINDTPLISTLSIRC